MTDTVHHRGPRLPQELLPGFPLAVLCLGPGWYRGGSPLLRILEKGPARATVGTGRRWGAGKVPQLCYFTSARAQGQASTCCPG